MGLLLNVGKLVTTWLEYWLTECEVWKIVWKDALTVWRADPTSFWIKKLNLNQLYLLHRWAWPLTSYLWPQRCLSSSFQLSLMAQQNEGRCSERRDSGLHSMLLYYVTTLWRNPQLCLSHSFMFFHSKLCWFHFIFSYFLLFLLFLCPFSPTHQTCPPLPHSILFLSPLTSSYLPHTSSFPLIPSSLDPPPILFCVLLLALPSSSHLPPHPQVTGATAANSAEELR